MPLKLFKRRFKRFWWVGGIIIYYHCKNRFKGVLCKIRVIVGQGDKSNYNILEKRWPVDSWFLFLAFLYKTDQFCTAEKDIKG